MKMKHYTLIATLPNGEKVKRFFYTEDKETAFKRMHTLFPDAVKIKTDGWIF